MFICSMKSIWVGREIKGQRLLNGSITQTKLKQPSNDLLAEAPEPEAGLPLLFSDSLDLSCTWFCFSAQLISSSWTLYGSTCAVTCFSSYHVVTISKSPICCLMAVH